MTKLVIDTDVASYIFKWHPEFAPQYAEILHASKPVLSFMTLAEMRQGALDANWGPRQCNLLETYLADFLTRQSNDALCAVWAEVRNENRRKGRPIASADAWIAATTLILSIPLVTNNTKHYRHLSKLQVISIVAG